MEILSYILAAIGIYGAFLAGNNRWGWIIGIIYQILWIWYAYATQQYSFIVVCIVYTVVYLRNFTKGGRNESNS